MGSAEARLHAIVEGDVQGVGFRYFVASLAEPAGLAGWVRNRSDGTVECVVEGPRSALESLLADLRRGPGSASVADVRATWEETRRELRGFEIRG